jgi:hypothetical protein
MLTRRDQCDRELASAAVAFGKTISNFDAPRQLKQPTI